MSSGYYVMIEVWIDGGASPNPGSGSWAYVKQEGGGFYDSPEYKSGHECWTTNNRMELTALLKALCSLPDRGATAPMIYTDSEYVWKGATRWVWKWIADEVLWTEKKNPDLWAVIAKQLKRVRPSIQHVDREEVDRAHRIAQKHRFCRQCEKRE